ncbi:hypothetical protein PFISCL1PPCAC_20961 [Pristionchus fissidentatus]|uniref:Uncharacterized protein n=1 Tax=Pristionchus fissidentatus TaxID=1538716 RepID=A0AAV5WIQ6_9BILA|nr:hypothetical protein PFISCL1PPCAC_20961 [Pristionchus fissidentatus]
MPVGLTLIHLLFCLLPLVSALLLCTKQKKPANPNEVLPPAAPAAKPPGSKEKGAAPTNDAVDVEP